MNTHSDTTRDAAPVRIDGATGEGGGQIVRSALSLSLVTGRPVAIDNIRARRRRPGLMRQHLTAVEAAQRIGSAQVTGAEAGSRTLTFAPQTRTAGDYRFVIGTAGSTTLVAQTVLPALALAEGASSVTIQGGTHNPLSPPFDFLERAFAPRLAAMGVDVSVELVRAGFFPAGGGELRFAIRGAVPTRLDIPPRTTVRSMSARCIVADLPESIADREAEVLRKKLGIPREQIEIVRWVNGPGNVCTVDVETDAGVEVFTSFGAPRVPAEKVASNLVREVKAFLRVPTASVGPHLADQLLLPMALAGGGSFHGVHPTSHAETNARVIQAFLPVSITFEQDGDGWRYVVERHAS